MTATVGIRSGNVIVPYVSVTKRTKSVALSASDVTAGTNLSNISFKAGYITCYADSAGNWFAEGNFSLTADFANASSWVLNIPNLVCKSGTGYYQEISLQSAVGVFLNIYASGSAFTIESSGNLSGNTKYVFASFKLALNAEPTAYTTANLEGVIAADVYIAPASGASPGIVDGNAATWNGVKTYTNGIVLGAGNETLSVYDEGTWTPAETSKSNLTGTSSFGAATYTRIGNTVFARIVDITGLTTSSTGQTYVEFSTTGLPGNSNGRYYYGCGYTTIAGGSLTASVVRSGTGSTYAVIIWNSQGSSQAQAIQSIFFQYTL